MVQVFNHHSIDPYLQRLGELDKIPLYGLAGVDLGAQTDHLAAQLQTLLLQGRLTATEKTVRLRPPLCVRFEDVLV